MSTSHASHEIRPPGRWHENPPFSPRHVFEEEIALAAAFVLGITLALLAGFDDGRVLLRFDEPVQEWVVEQRTPDWDTFFQWTSRLGDNIVVFALALTMALIALPRCRFLAAAILLAVAFRPALEFVMKAVIERDRPDIEPLSDFMGPSHPSGHPMAFLSVWGLLPPLLALYGASKRVWWTAVGFVCVGAVGVAAARVYRGAHWTTDVVASLLWASLYLLAVQLLYEWAHTHRLCSGRRPEVREDAAST